MARLVGFSRGGVEAILATHWALRAFAPEWVTHFDRALTEVRFAPGECGPGAAACVRASDPRVAFFELAPEHLPMIELGRILLHEARHWQQDRSGNWYVLPHSCGDRFCDRLSERRDDFVYHGDELARPHIDRALRAAGYDPNLPWMSPPKKGAGLSFGDVLVAAAAVLVVGGGLAVALRED